MKKDHPHTFNFPPLYYLLAIALGVGINKVVPLTFAVGSDGRMAIGIFIALIGLAITAAGILQFKFTRNNPMPNTPAKSIVKQGPYRFTRNPMYLGWVLMQSGIGVAAGNAWIILLVLPVMIVIQQTVILKEEAYLERAFGKQYARYKTDVRRWL